MTKELTCIICPKGCNIKVEFEKDKVTNIEGNTCKRGYDYAFSEITNPVFQPYIKRSRQLIRCCQSQGKVSFVPLLIWASTYPFILLRIFSC